MRNYFTGFLLLLTTGFSLAQTPAAPSTTTTSTGLTEDVQAKGNAKIIGYVVDSTLTKVVEFANIALYNSLTNKLIDGTAAERQIQSAPHGTRSI